jgi:hypothetical protein
VCTAGAGAAVLHVQGQAREGRRRRGGGGVGADYEASPLEALKPHLKASIDRGVTYVQQQQKGMVADVRVWWLLDLIEI